MLPIFYAENCFNSSTDTKDVLLICLGQRVDSLIVVSSYWHNWVLKQTYKRCMEKLNYYPEIVFIHPKENYSGIKTVLTYAIFGIVMKLSTVFGFADALENFLNKKQVKRKNGYPFSGCD